MFRVVLAVSVCLVIVGCGGVSGLGVSRAETLSRLKDGGFTCDAPGATEDGDQSVACAWDIGEAKLNVAIVGPEANLRRIRLDARMPGIVSSFETDASELGRLRDKLAIAQFKAVCLTLMVLLEVADVRKETSDRNADLRAVEQLFAECLKSPGQTLVVTGGGNCLTLSAKVDVPSNGITYSAVIAPGDGKR